MTFYEQKTKKKKKLEALSLNLLESDNNMKFENTMKRL